MATQTYLYTRVVNSHGEEMYENVAAMADFLESTGIFEVLDLLVVDINTTTIVFRHIISGRLMTLKIGKKGGFNGADELLILGNNGVSTLQTLLSWEYSINPPLTFHMFIASSDKGFLVHYKGYSEARIYGITDNAGVWYMGNGSIFYPQHSEMDHSIVTKFFTEKTNFEQYIYTPAVIKNNFTTKAVGIASQVFGISNQVAGWYTLGDGKKAYVYNSNLMYVV